MGLGRRGRRAAGLACALPTTHAVARARGPALLAAAALRRALRGLCAPSSSPSRCGGCVGTCAGSVRRAPSGDLLNLARPQSVEVRALGSWLWQRRTLCALEPCWRKAFGRVSRGARPAQNSHPPRPREAAERAGEAGRGRGVQDPGESPNRFAGVPSASRLAWLSSRRRGRGRRALARPRTNPRPRGLAGELPSVTRGGLLR